MRFFRTLFMYLMNNERLINRLADSKPIRRAAQFVAYLLVRSGTLHGAPPKITNPHEFIKQLRAIAQAFKDELRQVKDDIKKNPPK